MEPADQLQDLADRQLLRQLHAIPPLPSPHLEREGQPLLNFSSNDYLGLSQHPALVEAALRATRDYGTGATASRLICGSLQIFHELEERIADLKGTEAALSFSSGTACAAGCLPVIVGKGDTVLADKLSHACLLDAARASGATLRIFPHNHLGKLEHLLQSSSEGPGRTLILTESVFSMDGDLAPLTDLCALKEKYGALLWLDEAHALGVLGPRGLGLAEERGLGAKVNFQMGTLGKAVGSAGGYLAASRSWIDLFINRARTFIFSTAPPAAQAAASLAGLEIISSQEGKNLRRHLDHLRQKFDAPSAIIPLILGESEAALAASATLIKAGFYLPAIRYPSVPRKQARLRLTLTASHQEEHLETLHQTLSTLDLLP